MPLSEKTKTAVSSADTPTTEKDMEALMKWEFGDVIHGSHAKEHLGMKNYMSDINKAYGKQSKNKDIYIDNFKKISDELKTL
jgi:hypothetical protein